MRFPMVARATSPALKAGNVTKRKDAGHQRSSPLGKKDRYALGSPISIFSGKGSNQENTPIIDRIPTAIGYNSDGSEDEWLDEKSKCSRYASLAEERLDDDELREVLSDDEPYEGDDKYSSKRQESKETSAVATQKDYGIERLWSESTDDSSPPENLWKKFEEKQEVDAYYQPEDVSFLSESKNDPIYDTKQITAQRKSRIKKKPRNAELEVRSNRNSSTSGTPPTAEGPVTSQFEYDTGLPPNQSYSEEQVANDRVYTSKPPTSKAETSALTDPLEPYMATDKLVKEIEEKLKILKKAAAKEKRDAAKRLREQGRKNRRDDIKQAAVDEQKTPKRGNRSKSPPRSRTKRSSRKQNSKPVTSSAPNGTKTAEPTKKETAKKDVKTKNFLSAVFKKKVKNAESDDKKGHSLDAKQEGQLKGKPNLSLKTTMTTPKSMMYTKSLLTEDDFDSKQGDVLPPDEPNNPPRSPEKPEMELYMKSMLTEDTTEKKPKHSKKSKKESRQWNFGRLKNTKKNHAVSVSKEDEVAAERETAEEKVLSPQSKNSGVVELDEYSGFDSSQKDEAALIQCLKFYACGAVADKVDGAMEAAETCHPIVTCGDHCASGGIVPQSESPKPTIEIVLEELDAPETGVFSPDSDSPSLIDDSITEDNLPEAPDLSAASATSSFVLEVSDMNLHLDGDRLADPHDRDTGETVSADRMSHLSITSIDFAAEEKQPIAAKGKFSFPRFLLGKKSKA